MIPILKILRRPQMLKINKLTVNDKKFDFANGNTLIYSNKNSVGKTTLIRILLYSMGYNVPSTKGLSFKKLNLKLQIDCDGNKEVIERYGNRVVAFSNIFFMDSVRDRNELHSRMSGISDPQILKNILALVYFDQEKGWTLLNRGTVIGGIKFKIEDLIEGLGQLDVEDIRQKIDNIDREIKIYRQLIHLINIQAEFRGDDDYADADSANDSSLKELQDKHRILKMQIAELNHEINQFKGIKKDNEKLIELIEDSGINIRVKGIKSPIPVTRKNILGFNINQNLINVQIERKLYLKSKYNKEIVQVENKLNEKMRLVNVENQISKLSQFIQVNNLTPENINIIIDEKDKERKKLTNKLIEILNNDDVTFKVFKRVKQYCNLLGVEDSLDEKKNFIYTTDLKRYSGAKLHLLVFAFRLALLKEVELKEKINVPIILDSPTAGELDKNNLEKMFALLKQEFNNNQLIVASIASKETFKRLCSWSNIIELESHFI